MSSRDRKTALIAGSTGAIGGAVGRELVVRGDWSVHGLSRRQPDFPIEGTSYHLCDLDDADQAASMARSLAEAGHDPTHIFYCARATHAEQLVEDAEGNLRLLRNLVDAVENHASKLRHIHLVQGGKYYGVHVGSFITPARETDARAPIENFNYAQQDFLVDRCVGSSWTWTASRPNTLLHFSPQNGRNLVSSLGVYAALCREMGAALDFPGHPGAWDSVTQVTSLDLLARAIVWMSTASACENQGFNVTNTDVFRWSRLWPKIAAAFDMSVGEIRPLTLKSVMSRRDQLWTEICRRHDLSLPNIDLVANWGFLDATLERYWDEILCHNRVRELGFDDWDNSEAAFFRKLDQYRVARILPG